MKTEDLIKMLSTNVPPVRRQRFGGTLLIALGVGIATALCFECAMYGTRLDGLGETGPGLHLGVIALTSALVAAGSRLLFLSARPGERSRGALLLIGLVLLAILLTTLFGLTHEPIPDWRAILGGAPMADCLICLPIVAVPTLVALFWALRQGAPAYPTLTGTVAGLIAGALAVVAFALHQPAASILATAVLYGGSIVVCGLIGAVVGSRLLRW